VRVNNIEYAWCNNCEEIQPVIVDKDGTLDVGWKYSGRDICCSVCSSIIATIYEKVYVSD